MPLLSFHKVTKYYGAQCVLQGISWGIDPGQHVGLIGSNGTGKTTMLQLITGDLSPDEGEISRRRDLRTGYLTQDAHLTATNSVLDEALSSFERIHALEKQLREAEAALENAKGDAEETERRLGQYGRLTEAFEQAGGYTYPHRAKTVLHGLGFKEEDLPLPVNVLSGGQKTRLRLGKLLLGDADLLLLDEPESHLDVAATEWLEEYITDHPAAILLVSHDRYFLDRTVNRIAELEDLGLQNFPGNYTRAMEVKAERLKSQQRAYDQQQAFIKEREEFIRRTIEGVKTKQAQGRRSHLARLKRLEKPRTKHRSASLNFGTMRRSGRDVLALDNVSKSYGTRTLFSELHFTQHLGDRVGLIGYNGAGKTTLLRMIVGQETPSSGTIRLGTGVDIGYYDQERASLTGERSVLNELWSVRPGMNEGTVRNLLGRFLFRGDDVFKQVNLLSGGEQGRLALAKLILEEPNFLVLDEPTNHLDILSRQALEQALADYPGTLMVASHDRYFLDQMVSALLIFEQDGVRHWEGTYSEYRAFKEEQRLAAVRAKEKKPRRRAGAAGDGAGTAGGSAAGTAYDPRKKERKEQRMMAEALEAAIRKKEAEIARLEGDLGEEGTFSDREQVERVGSAYMRARQELEDLYLEWEVVAMELED